jgi:subfamily B ATP-binding cassette protein MsbA
MTAPGTAGARAPRRKVDPKSALREAQALFRHHRKRLLIGLGLMLVSRAAGLVLPASTKYFVDVIIASGDVSKLPLLAGAVVAATLIQGGTGFALSQLLGVAAQRAITDMRRRVEAHILRLPVQRFDSTQTGQLVARVMNDADGIRNLIGSGLVQLVGGSLTAVVAFGVLWWINWKLTAMVLAVMIAWGVTMSVAFKRLRPLFRERGQLTAEAQGRLQESFGGIRVVKSYVAERREEYAFTKAAHKLFRNVAKSMTGVSATTSLATVVIGLAGALVMYVGGLDITAGTMTVGDLVMYITFVGLVAAPIVQIASISTQVTEAFAGLDRIREILNTPTEDDEDASRAPVPVLRSDVAFDDVTFAYEAGVPVLKGVSFSAPAGTTTALVGTSGSGKSTILSLVMAFNRPQQGRVLVDGHDLASLRLRDYRSHLGIVLQDNFLFDGTVADNIRFANPEATMADVERVGAIARVHDFVKDFPQGYKTVVGERGVKLSGGQRQRVAIARAILADPAILILDEATSSLDSESEAAIQAGLAALRKGRTTFVIAHRLSTITSADQILVVEDGRIAERGSHRELLALGGRYRALYDRQYRLESDRFVNPGEELVQHGADAAS